MFLTLTDLSVEPLQQQIIRQIRAKILTGELPAGTDLPSIRSFARDHHVSVITVQRAYEELVRQELIHSRRGKGFFVSNIDIDMMKKMAQQRIFDNIEPLIIEGMADGLSVEDVITIVKMILQKNQYALGEEEKHV